MDFSKTQKYICDLNNYKLICRVGAGQFGTVFKYEKKDKPGEFVAVKVIESPSNSPEVYKNFTREVTIQANVDHPACISLLSYHENCKTPNGMAAFIMSPYMKNGSLDNFIKDANALTPTQKMIILYGSAVGMRHLHQIGVMHRDLKPGNILLDDKFYPYIADFGFSKFSPKGQNASFSIRPGTPLYQAPELIQGEDEELTNLVDVYAYGIIVFNVLTGLPFSNKTNAFQLMQDTVKGVRPTIPDFVPPQFRQLIVYCWSPVVKERPTFIEIVENLENPDFALEGTDMDEFFQYVNYLKEHDEVFSSSSSAVGIPSAASATGTHIIHNPSVVHDHCFSASANNVNIKTATKKKFMIFTFIYKDEMFQLELGENILASDALSVASFTINIPISKLIMKEKGSDQTLLPSQQMKKLKGPFVIELFDIDDLPDDPDELEVEVAQAILLSIRPQLLQILKKYSKIKNTVEITKNFSSCGRSISLFKLYFGIDKK
ncbi:hypothetical protein TRFO_17715 [Tritrichomonas foetus]|uniref:Protein kinase domain-containing protein n=1 Tax=Tritrichomonas foetus TaxID=1144522 RepID=A0A1J4KMV3_9EUKA|nr:hypothetical protein TRFO_17715 [Tritrichomonas foetus]|eukprot:OHT12442.1 hypothetical protein TRFO_17715 [Tritrichomonas foetus]